MGRKAHLKEGNAAVLAYVVAGLLLINFVVMVFSVFVVHKAKSYAQKKRQWKTLKQPDHVPMPSAQPGTESP